MSFRADLIAFLDATVAAALPTSPLYQIEVNDTPADPYTKDKGLTVGFPRFSIAPNGAGVMKEYDGDLELLAYSRVRGIEKTHRQNADNEAMAIALAIAAVFKDNPTLNGVVCDATCTQGEGGWDAEDGQPYQLVGLRVRYNQIGPVTTG